MHTVIVDTIDMVISITACQVAVVKLAPAPTPATLAIMMLMEQIQTDARAQPPPTSTPSSGTPSTFPHTTGIP